MSECPTCGCEAAICDVCEGVAFKRCVDCDVDLCRLCDAEHECVTAADAK